jgi:EAL domain-containing protein (putative c-di-GMP-specific phosphodiesterase class I)
VRLSVVAEGVETRAQLETLAALGCDEFQGFLESPALAPAQLEKRYAAR